MTTVGPRSLLCAVPIIRMMSKYKGSSQRWPLFIQVSSTAALLGGNSRWRAVEYSTTDCMADEWLLLMLTWPRVDETSHKVLRRVYHPCRRLMVMTKTGSDWSLCLFSASHCLVPVVLVQITTQTPNATGLSIYGQVPGIEPTTYSKCTTVDLLFFNYISENS